MSSSSHMYTRRYVLETWHSTCLRAQWLIPKRMNYLSYSCISQWKTRCVLYCIRYSYFHLLIRIRENKFNPIKISILLVKVSSNSDGVELVFSDSHLKMKIWKSNSIEITSSFSLSDIRVTKIIHIPWDNSLRSETGRMSRLWRISSSIYGMNMT
jgi:hypothetical protein